MYSMRTNIEIDEKLMNEILQKTSIKTKKEAVDTALREFLRKIKLQELAELRGKIKWEGNLEEMRSI
jgi:Arc/MetJ family transcription regulator